MAAGLFACRDEKDSRADRKAGSSNGNVYLSHAKGFRI